ncbi:MAG: hypothetical protein NW224_11930 [Leptolyngbyaceae cyanobacterium bins.302]|nr:hypothetical protein [Leptolyngbyaceae cyanobacterium bins.302]
MQAVKETLAGWQQSLFSDIEAYWLENPPPQELTRQQGTIVKKPKFAPEPTKRKRVQVGWIETRYGNKSRETQYLSLYYCCYLSEREIYGSGQGRKKHRVYLQAHQCNEISLMVRNKQPYTEILKRIGETKRHSDRLHHTKEWG